MIFTTQTRSAETTEPLAYWRLGGNGRQIAAHEVFEKIHAVPLELLLQGEAPDFLKGYQQKKRFSSIAANFDWLGAMGTSHSSTNGNTLLFIISCRKQ